MNNEIIQKKSSKKKNAKNAQKGVRHFLRSKQHSSIEIEKIIVKYNNEVTKKKDASKKLLYSVISEDFYLFKNWYSKNY
mgnify:CR=1 FL=1